MKNISSMSTADHERTGLQLFFLREQLIIIVSPQLQYARNQRMYRRITGQLNKVFFALDTIRDFLNSVAAHELKGDLSFIFYYPGSQDVKSPSQLVGISPERAKRLQQNSVRRELLESDGRKPGGVDSEDRNTLILFLNSVVSNCLAELSIRSQHWPNQRLAKKIRSLCLKCKSSASAFAISLQEL